MNAINRKFEVEEFDYIRKITSLLISIFFTKKRLQKREKEFLDICLLGLRKGWKNPNSGEFFKLFEKYYFTDKQSQKQKASLLCTQRKKLVAKGLIDWNKNTETLTANPIWGHLENDTKIELEFSVI